mmetsp:Transcript_10793/g.32082  ORF Transcript_10793/g.32082 Transcript_10793/m.32082 type:complete len:284 (-) Transcript_10793:737-1588(-)
MVTTLRSHLQQHPPDGCFLLLENIVLALNSCLCVGVIAAAGFAAHAIYADLRHGSNAPLWLWLAAGCAAASGLLCMMAVVSVAVRSLRLLTVYVVCTAIAMSAELCCAVLLVVKESPKPGPGPGPGPVPPRVAIYSGDVVAAALAGVGADGGNVRTLKILAASAFFLQALTLVLTCLLQCQYQNAVDLALDMSAEEAEWASAARSPLLHAGSPDQAPRLGPSGWKSGRPPPKDEWGKRMQERYGIDTARLTYQPDRGDASQEKASEQTAPRREERRGRICSIM